MPIAIKDNFCTVDLPTTCGSTMLQDFHSPYDATVVQRLREAGAKIMGKTNMDEFGMGSANLHSHVGPVKNPYVYKIDPTTLNSGFHVAGGSSGGSAAAVAMDMCDVALGSDTGGSVRLPAAYCGVYGFKPSYGHLSRNGLVAYANSLDTVGLLGKRIRDLQQVYDVLNAYDEKDPTSTDISVRQTLQQQQDALLLTWKEGDLTGLRVGVPSEYFVDPLSKPVLAAWRSTLQQFKKQGATIVPVSLPHTKDALPAYYILALAEASSNLARFDGIRYGYRSDEVTNDLIYADSRTKGFGEEVQRRILLGTHVLTAGTYESHFLPAQLARRQIAGDFDRVFLMDNVTAVAPVAKADEQVHVLLTPCSISTAPLASECQAKDQSVVDAYVNDVMTVPASLAGLPALAFPAGCSEENGFPIGLQLIGQYGFDRLVLHLANSLQSA
ncbi:amidase signature enzyme [Hesseltinella vesiculosa]|uniref:Glutamyl-tRNA(Gln) amidotransferase subunit A, mitochondrial n=1 Tax=Hesseltinella vesiculosa TaxID=101127 RepID=A0A1X2GG65_9FUNG|nr:amidase signature enzyme [Hesseltinella vesiculosa]